MPRRWIVTLSIVVLLAVSAPAPHGLAVEPSPNLLPAYTKGFLSITDMRTLLDHWNATQLGQLMQDPIMQPFLEDFERQVQQQWLGGRTQLGLTIDDIRDIPTGEVAVAMLQPAPGQSASVLLAVVTGNREQAEEVLARASGNLVQQGAVRRSIKLGDLAVQVLDLPKRFPDDEDEPRRQVVYVLEGDLMIVADNVVAVEAVLERLNGKKTECLADVEAFQATMQRCEQDAGGEVPQIRWFLEIFGYLEAAQVNVPPRERRRGRSMLATLRNQGFEAIQGAGGYVSFATEGYEWMHRTAVHAPPPYEKSMKMLRFPNRAEFTPQPWIPRDIAAYATAFFDIANAFDNFGPMFDEMFGEGEEGVWEDVLRGLLEDKHGPQIHLKNELIDYLEDQVTVVTDYELPVTTASERILIAIKVRNEPAVTSALEKLLKADDTVQARVLDDRIIWEAIPRKKPQVPSISLVLPGDELVADEEADPLTSPLFPNAAVTAANGHLLIASHLDFLVKMLQEREEREMLASTVDFQVVGARIAKFSEERCAWVFSRTDEEYRATYELIREGRMPESETMLGRVLNTLFGAGKKGVLRQQEIDGSKLPDFEVVRRHLGVAGGFGVSEKTGWFLKGFMLSKEAE